MWSRNYLTYFLFIILLSFFATNAQAANKFWVASGSGDKIWWDNNNWSNSDNGPPGADPPANNDQAFFTGNGLLDVKITTNVKILKLILKKTYTGTVRIEGGLFTSRNGLNQQGGNILVSGTGRLKVTNAAYNLGNPNYNTNASLIFEDTATWFKVFHNFIMYPGTTFTAPSSGTDRFIVKGGFNNYGGIFNHNNGTLWMSPAWDANNSNTAWGAGLNIVGSGTGRNLYNFTKNGRKNVSLASNIVIENNLRVIGTGRLRSNNKNITIGGNWYMQKSASFIRSTSIVTFNGSSAQTINSAAQFHKVTIANIAGEVSLVGSNAGRVANTLTINNGATFDINGRNLTANTLVNNGNLQLLGSETVSITSMDTDSGTVTYDGSNATGLAAGNSYFGLTFDQSGTSTLDANLDVNGDLTITNGTLDASSSSHDINVGGDWTNNGSFISRAGTVTFDNDSNVFSGGTGTSNDFNDVVLSGTAGSQSDDIKVNGDFTISSTGTWSTNCNTLTVSGTKSAGSGTIAGSLTPDVSEFIPAHASSAHASSDNIIIKFNTGLRQANDSDLTNSNIDAHITLKDTNSSGSNIDFVATIDTADQVVTINPDANFNSSQVVHVAVTNNTLENACDTALPAHSATFTVADTEGPTLSSSNPTDGATTMGVNSNIVLTFNETVSVASGNITIHSGSTEIESIDVTGSKVTGAGSTEITVNPDTTLDEKTDYYIKIESGSFEDSSDNPYTGIANDSDLNFTTVDTTAPVVTITPSNGQTGIGMNTNLTIEFDEAIRKASDDTEITDSSVSNHIILKETNSSGADISFDATINSDKTLITINPSSDFSSGQTIYAAVKAEVEDASDNAISLTESTFTTATPTNPPAVTISSEAGVPVDTNITIEFDKSVRLLGDGELSDTNVGSLITLKDTDINGTDISFVAIVNSAKTKITINPISSFNSGQNIFVAIGATVEDFFDNSINAASETFTAADSLSPTYVFDPTDSEINVSVSADLKITFNEAVRKISNTILTDINVDSLITLKDTDENGSNIAFNATIDSDKKIITINPTSSFSSQQEVYLAIGATVEDYSGNAITASSSSFTAVDSNPPDVDFFPTNSSTGIAVNSDVTISFSEPIRKIDNTPITDTNVSELITLKQNNSSGSNISFSAVIDNAKQMITITPTSELSSEQVVYVAIGATVEDEWDNAISASSLSFTTADATAPSVNFDPVDTATGIPIESNVTLTFTEAIRNIDDTALTNSNVGDLISLEYAYDHSPIAFTATINTVKKVITINPNSNFISGEVVFISIESVEDSSGNAMSATSGTFSVTDSTAPVVTFSPGNLSTNVSVDTDIIINFDEEIRLIDNSDINNINVDNLITVKDTNSNGSDISFDATIDADNKVITIELSSDLSSEQIVYVAIGSTVEDSYDNAITNSFAIFTVGDSLPPTVSIDAVITASIATNSDITFTFSEAVRNLDDSEITNSNVGSLITLKDTDASGADLSFTATINTAKTVITIDPTNNFTSGQIVYSAIGATVEDFNNNVIPATSKTFIAEYLVADLTNPLENKDFVGLLEAQTETAKRFIQHSTASVLKRMEWLRRNREDKNLSHQGVNINFKNSELNELSSAFQLSNVFNQSGDLFSDDWAIWSSGSVTIGEVDTTSISSLKDIETIGITLGIDNKIDSNHMFGIALRLGNDDIDIGSAGHELDTDTYSLSLYGTLPFNDETYIDATFGIGLLDINHKRKHISGTLTGKRNGEQVFGSIVFGGELKKDNITMSPYGRIDGGYTVLSSYTDSGTIAAIKYNEQKVKTGIISIGLLVDDEIDAKKFKINDKLKFDNLKIKRYGRLEYGRDITSSSDAVVSYVAIPNTKYSLNINNKESNILRFGIGTDIELGSKWSYQFDYEINHRSALSHLNTFSAAAFYELGADSTISLSLDSELSTHSIAKLELDTRLKNGWFLNGAYEMKDYKDLNNENILRLQAVRYF